jgi:hypothetical protein
MTISEALAATVLIENIPADSFEKALIDVGLTGSDTYTTDDKVTVNTAALSVLNGLLYSSISEGGYSISFDRSAIEARIKALGGGPKVRGVNVW